MHVVAIGKSAVGTRYIAERDANQEREGNHRRPLFSITRNDLTPAQANHVLTDGRGKPNKVDVRHIVISPENARAYESLGDTDDERKENFMECARATMTRFAESLGVRELRWIAGIHLNTDHPHVHILFHKDAIDAATGRPTRIKHIPQEWLMHNETVPVEHHVSPVEQTVRTEPEAEGAAAATGEGGEESKAGETSEKIAAYQPARGAGENYQQFRGAYLILEKQSTREGERDDRKASVAVKTKDVYDPKGLLEGTDQARSAVDEERMLERLSGVPLQNFRDAQTDILIEYGYKAAVDWESGEQDSKDPRRELTVFDAARVSQVVEGPESEPERERRDEAAQEPEATVRVNYGKLGVYFREEIDKRAYPVRQIAFHIDHSDDFTRRDLLDPNEKKPTDTERLVGRWVMMEARLNGHEDRGTRILRLRLREEVARLDAAALERSEPPPKAFIPTTKLQDAIAENQISVLRADGSLSPRYHTSEPTRAELTRARILDLQPSHGGQIYGLIATDSGRMIAREVVTVGPALRMPVQQPEPAQSAPAVEESAAAVETPRAVKQHQDTAAGEPEPAAREVSESEANAGAGWSLNIYVEDDRRADVVDALPTLREKYGLQFTFSAAVEREEGRFVVASFSDRRGKETWRDERAQEKSPFSEDRLILIHAGARDNAELVATAIHRELGESLSGPPKMPIAGEEFNETFRDNVVGYFQINAVDEEFSSSTKRGIPFTKDDYEQLMSGLRVASAAGTPKLRERREEAIERADALLTARYGSFYAGGSNAAPERAEREQEGTRTQAEEPQQRHETNLGARAPETPEREQKIGAGWRLSVTVAEEQRSEFAERLSALRESNGVEFSYMLWLDAEQGHGITSSVSDAQGRETLRMHSLIQAQGMVVEEVVTIHAGSRENAERVTNLIDTHLSDLTSEPRRGPIPGEVSELAFSKRVEGHFDVQAVEPDFSNFTRWGVPFLKDDNERLAADRRPPTEANAESRREALEQGAARADGVLKERYGAYYAGAYYVAPERAEQQQVVAEARVQPTQEPQQAQPEQARPYEPRALKGGKDGWVHVTPDNCCPVCHKPDNCAISTDGKRAYCRRVESDRPGRDGGYTHDLTKLADYEPKEQAATAPAVVQYEKRPIEDRDRINRKILDALKLEKRDLDNLLGRGLTEEAIEHDGYVSVPVRAQANQIAERLAAEGEDLRGVPGFWKATDEEGQSKWQLNLNYWYRGVMIPVTDAQGHVDGFQIRRAEVQGKEPKYVWLSSKSRQDSPKPEGTPSGAPVHYKNVENIRQSGEAILTEGSLKANIISNYLDRGVVAIAGVSVFQDDFGEKLKQDIPELQRVWIAYDADATEKKEVQKALERVAGVLSKAGLEVGVLSWELEEGKGLDDYLQNRLGADFHKVEGQERGEKQLAALAGVGWTEGEIPTERRPPQPAITLQPGVIDEATGREVTEEELTVSAWLHEEARAAEEGNPKDLRGLRDRVGEIDKEAAEGQQPEVPAVMLPADLQAGVENGKLLTHEQLIAHQRMLDRVTLGKEVAARLELIHTGEKYNRCLEQAETRRYRVLDASTNLVREISARDIEQRAQARSNRAADERADEVERADPRERRDVRNGIKQEEVSNDLAAHESTVEAIIRKHAEQLSGLDRKLRLAYIEHDDLAPQAHAVERAYRARGEDMPTPFIPDDTLDRLHEQALERRDADTIKYLNDVRTNIAKERGEPARNDEQAARLSAQHNVARGDLKVAERREEEFRESSHNRKWEIEGEAKKWSLSDVDKEQARKERELEYLSTSGRFFGSDGLAVNLFKQQVLQRFNPINSLRPSSLSPLYAIKHHPAVKAVRIGYQIYKWYERGKEAEQLAQAAADTIEHMKGLRTQVQEKIDARHQELSNEIQTQGHVTETLGQIQEHEAAARALRGLEPVQAKYSDWELRRLETNSMELRDREMLREYERAAGQRVTEEVSKLTSDLAEGKSMEDAARELVENRIKDAMRQLEPTAKQLHRLTKEGAEVPLNRMLASEKIEELTGEEAVWKAAGRAAVEELKASGQPLTPESLLEAHRTDFGGRAVAREVVTEARMRDAANRLEQFREFRDITQIRYATPEGTQQVGNLKETEPKSWLDKLKHWISEDPSNAAKREAIERALGEEEARLRTAHEEARDFHDAARDIADEYRAQLPGEELQPQFTSKEAAEIERFGGGLRPEELTRLEQLAELTERQAEQVQFSRIIQDALAEGRVANDPGAQSSQRTQEEKSPAEREADPVEREARELAENPELSEGLTTEVGGAEAAATAEVEEEIEESLSLLL